MSIVSFSNPSSWSEQFTFHQVKPLIVCRGPIRKETIEVFEALGTQSPGILLSEKDCIVYPQTLAPELRMFTQRAGRVHHVPDYMGNTRDEKTVGIQRIIGICKTYHYTHVFAGYGFMAEDAEFVDALEKARIGFIGPNSQVIHQAGTKDEAKQLARQLGVSVTPGIDNLVVLALLSKAGKNPKEFFDVLQAEHNLLLPQTFESLSIETQAECLLSASYEKGGGPCDNLRNPKRGNLPGRNAPQTVSRKTDPF